MSDQWQSLYGTRAGDWLLVTGQVGAVVSVAAPGFRYLGDPSELLRKVHSYRLTRSSQPEHLSRVIAGELGLTKEAYDRSLIGTDEMKLSSDGWSHLVRSVLVMTDESVRT